MHFDSSDNLLTQLSGFKRVILVSPEYWRELHMFSSLHPLTRQSQLPFEDGPWAMQFKTDSDDIDSDKITATDRDVNEFSAGDELVDKLNHFNNNIYKRHSSHTPQAAAAVADILKYHNHMIRKIEFEYHVLKAGDVLKIPPFYFHSVSISAEDMHTSVSINNYVTHQEHKDILARIYALKLKKKSLKLSLQLLFHKLHMDIATLAQDILRSRWFSINNDQFLSGNLTKATDFELEGKVISLEKIYMTSASATSSCAVSGGGGGDDDICSYLDQQYGGGEVDEEDANNEPIFAVVNDLINLFGRLNELVPDAFEMLVADYLEVVVAKTIGTKKVKSFLFCLGMMGIGVCPQCTQE
jgi:hypothetical protein